MEVPLHTLIKLTPKAYGTKEERFRANIPAVSTWREKGSSAKHASIGYGDSSGMASPVLGAMEEKRAPGARLGLGEKVMDKVVQGIEGLKVQGVGQKK